MASRLDKKVALVTGGSRGIGRAVCAALAREGAAVIVNYRSDEEAAKSTLEELLGHGGEHGLVKADVGSYEEVQSMMERVESEHGHLDVLVNNAGVHRGGRVQHLTVEDWDLVLRTHLYGSFYCAKEAVPLMRAVGGGRIVNVVSVVGARGFPGDSAYASAKAGMIGMTRSLALELVKYGILVNAVAPGYVATEMTEDLSEEGREALQNMVPMGHPAEPEEVASLVSFLSGPEASYITGATYAVDGGILA
jgi:3-oxoacyl-[acyl-carrier protein] reductase